MTDAESQELPELPVCRLCAKATNSAIGICSPKGVSQGLLQKINEHLPITVKQDDSDSFPLSVCRQCTHTLLAFDQLVITCMGANKQFEQLNTKLKDIASDPEIIVPKTEDENEEEEKPDLTSLAASYVQEVKTFCHDSSEKIIKIEPDIESLKTPKTEQSSSDNDDYVDEEDSNDSYKPTYSSSKSKSKRDQKSRKIYKTKRREELEKAEEIVDGKIYYKCASCGKILLSAFTYRSHMKIHTGERSFVCDLCGKQFRIKQGLVRHVRETHQLEKRFSCDICDRMFASRRNVEEHRRIHTNERPYVCDLCGKSFKQKASLFVHNRVHNDAFPFRCKYCNMGFHVQSAMLVHVTIHTGEKAHGCEFCGRRFRIKHELNRHILIHSDLKPFECEFCSATFRQKRYLRNHLKQVHKDKQIS